MICDRNSTRSKATTVSRIHKFIWISGAFVAAVFVGIMAVQREWLLFRFGVGLLFLHLSSMGTAFGFRGWRRFALQAIGLTGALAMFAGQTPFSAFGSPLALAVTPFVVAVMVGAILATTAIMAGLVLGARRRRSNDGKH